MNLLIWFLIIMAVVAVFYFISVYRTKKLIKQGIVISKEYLASVHHDSSALTSEDVVAYEMSVIGDRIAELRTSNIVAKSLARTHDLPANKVKPIHNQRIINTTQALAYNIYLENMLNERPEAATLNDINTLTVKDVLMFELEEYGEQITECVNIIERSKTKELDSYEQEVMDMINTERSRILA